MRGQVFKNEWEIKDNDFGVAGLSIADFVRKIAKEQKPQYLEFFPFSPAYKSDFFKEDQLVIIRLENTTGQMPTVGRVEDPKLIDLAKELFRRSNYPSFEDSFSIYQDKGFTKDIFTYIGRLEEDRLCWQHIQQNVVGWLNTLVLPSIIDLNEKRVRDAIPIPPKFDTWTLLENIYVIESESGMLQGTAFHLKGYGLVTCDHCVRNAQTGELLNDLIIFRGNDYSKKVSVNVVSSDSTMDIASLELDDESVLKNGLEIGSSDNLKHLDHIAVAGFPNYNYGDNGYFSPGLIVGFKTYSGLRHILVNVALVSGNSGGPAFDKDSKVIGVAVTGADKFSKALETEKHGLIPIETINCLKRNNSR